MSAASRAILLIDDQQDKLTSLAEAVRDSVEGATVRQWFPKPDEDLSTALAQKTCGDTVLVVTDYDLTTAVKGLLGHSVVAWCQSRFIPVGDFSRGHLDALSTEPDLFEIRVPHTEADAAAYIVRVFEGFRQIREGIEQDPGLLSAGRSPAQVLAVLLGRPNLESQLGPYFSRPGLFNASLLDTITSGRHGKGGATRAEKTRLLTYILGHVLLNAVLKYRGPILAGGPLSAYLAAAPEGIEKLAELFDGARYSGPFDDGERLFWRENVDETIEDLAQEFDVEDTEDGSFGDYHRAVIGKVLGGDIFDHECERCHGRKGGFWCPFTKRAVCERSDCSSTASSWVPSGAYACRVERDFFEEWSRVLGL